MCRTVIKYKQGFKFWRVKEYEVVGVPFLDRTTQLELTVTDLDLASPRAGEFKALERLELYARTFDMGNLLAMCPSLRSLKLGCSLYSEVVNVHSASLEKLDVVSDGDLAVHGPEECKGGGGR